MAHISYLLGFHGIRVSQSKTFSGYPELQVEKARDSLRAGAEFLRSRFSLPFIIEDTEVRVEAYSRDHDFTYPGFDIKRWWKVTSFEEIDAKCKQAGTRGASQASHVCLSIPGLPLLFYTGRVTGHIASEPLLSTEKPAEAPWLNAREFGSIFIPDGSEVPFVSLSVDESLKYDFRKRAIDRLAAKIKEINILINLDSACYRVNGEQEQSPNQLELYNLRDFQIAASDED